MIKILANHSNYPNIRSYTTVLFENVVPILNNFVETKIMWFIHNPFFSKSENAINNNLIDFHDFQNAVDVIKTTKPDLVYVLPGLSIIDYSFALAAKFCNVKIIGGQLGKPFFSLPSSSNILKSYMKQFFESSNHSQKLFLKNKFFIKKHIFWIKTLMAIQLKPTQICKEIFFIFGMYLRIISHTKIISKFQCDQIFVDNDTTAKKLYYIDQSKLIITGDPTYDQAFKTKKDFKKIKSLDKIKVLFITVNLQAQGGTWSKTKRNKMLKILLNNFQNLKDKFQLTIKIHPNNENIIEYQSIIDSIDPSFQVFQKENLFDLLNETDIVLTSSASTAVACALILNKPVIIWNFFDVKGDLFLENEIAVECTDISQISKLISLSLSIDNEKNQNIKTFLQNYFYKQDGLSSFRISDSIKSLLEIKNTDNHKKD
jgi:hypothetical protein